MFIYSPFTTHHRLSYFINEIIILKLFRNGFQVIGNAGINQFVSHLQYKSTDNILIYVLFYFYIFKTTGLFDLGNDRIPEFVADRRGGCKFEGVDLFMSFIL